MSSSTISRWLKVTLELSGVTELGSFSGHSTRSASTSKADLSGLAVTDILNRGSWSNESTWQKIYHKEVTPLEQIFQRTVFGTRKNSFKQRKTNRDPASYHGTMYRNPAGSDGSIERMQY